MTIEYQNDKTVKIVLTKEDLKKYNITYDELDNSKEKTKDFLLSVVKNIKEINDFKPNRIFIESFPTNTNGCILYVDISNIKSNKTTFDTPMIIEFSNLDTLTCLCNKLFAEYLYMIVKSSLYHYNEKYYLSIYSYCKMEKNLSYIVKEYGNLIGKGSIFSSFFQEHCKEIISENAIETVHKFLE